MEIHETNQRNGGGFMNGERVMRDWYAPLEIATLSTWLNVAIVVNIILLTFDVLRGDGTVSYTHLRAHET